MSNKRPKKDTAKNNKKVPKNKGILKLKLDNGAEYQQNLHTQRLLNTLKLMTLMLIK